MDFIYESKEQSKDGNESKENDGTNETNDTNETNETFKALENEITNTFNLFQSKASSFWSFTKPTIDKNVNSIIETTKGLKIEDRLNQLKKNVNNEENQRRFEIVKAKTDGYLNDLDKELETVENIASDYAAKLGGFLKNSISVSGPGEKNQSEDEEDVLIDSRESNLLFNVYGDDLNYYEDFNFKNESYQNFLKTFKLDDQAKDLKDSRLSELYDKLVVNNKKLSDEQFWSIYYFKNNNKKKSNIKNLNEEEEINWDDENDDDKNDANNDNKAREDQLPKESPKEDSKDNDDSDDDWE